jgi:hypothetical protein
MTTTSTRRLGIFVARSVTAWMTAPGTHLRASRHQFVTTLAGQTTRVGVNFSRSPARQERLVGVLPVPGAFATSTR